MGKQAVLSRHWRLPDGPKAPAEYLPEEPEVVRAILWRRGHRDSDAARAFLHPLQFRLPNPRCYPQLATAIDRIAGAIERGESLCVWGDYDADGQTATALLVGTLRSLGANVTYYLPRRLHEARGLDASVLERLAREGCRLVVTCDCGTSDAEAVERARELEIDVVITDHHQQMGPVPDAVAVCNSSHLQPSDPLWGLPGVAVSYVLARGLFQKMGRAAEEHRHLDLVALGIVADVAPLTPTNRALLARGLGLIWREPRPGIRALLDLSGAPIRELDTEPISFRLAPALNAAGRLADARVGVELLLTEDPDRARTLATELWALNTERKKLAAQLDGDVRASLAGQAADAPAMVLAGIGWHPGLIGVAASHLLHELGRTVVVISRDPAGGAARGSARSMEGVGVLEILAELTDLLGHWGGHSHAAGFYLPDQGIDHFRERFVEAVGRRSVPLGPSLQVDVVVPWSDVAARGVGEGSLYQTLSRLAPYSEGNRPPVLASLGLKVVARRPVGAGDRHTKLVLADDRQVCQEILWWNSDPTWEPHGLVDAAFTLSSNEWQGSARLRLTLEGIRPHAGRQEEHESST